MANIRLILVVHFLLAISLATTVLVSAQDAPQPLSDEEFEEVLISGDTLDWLKIVVMTDKQAKKIVKSGGPIANRADTETEKQLGFREIRLNGLTEITEKQAKIISSFKGHNVHLCGLDSLTDKQMKALCKLEVSDIKNEFASNVLGLNIFIRSMDVFLDGLISVTDKQAEYLSNMDATDLSLNGLLALNNAQVEAFKNAKADRIWLDGITSLTDAQMKALAETDIKFGLRGLGRDARSKFKSYGGTVLKWSERPKY